MRVQLTGALLAALALAGCSNDEPAQPSAGASGSAAGGTSGANSASGSGGSGTSAGAGAGAGVGGSGGQCAIATEKNTPVVVDCATAVSFRDLGNGFRMQAPDGSDCAAERTISLSFDTRLLTWGICVINATGPWKLDIGSRTLDAGELIGARAELHKVTVWSGQLVCGADKPTITLGVITPTGSQSYADSFYACNMEPGTIYVDNIDAGFSALADLAHE